MKKALSLILVTLLFVSCNNTQESEVKSPDKSELDIASDTLLKHVDWSKNATIYEANIRQITPEGTFKAFEEKLVAIKDLGIKIVWLMPIQPIGELNRKGGLGSYYSIKDYTAVNPEFGTLDEFKSLVDRAHELDLKIILDWVANHSAWDHPWTISNPEWYTKDSLGNFRPPVPDWSDVIDLNYDNIEMQNAMISDLKYWITETDIDGFRCDVAYNVPTEFWNRARMELDAVKPMFMLAEADQVDHHYKAFDMSYGWELMHLMKHVVSGDSSLFTIEKYMKRQQERFDKNDYRMHLLTSHDENSWNGTIEDRYGNAEKAVAVLVYTINGMPLVYSGQEYGNTKVLAFFEKDNPIYSNPEIVDFYKTMLHLNEANEALWNGNYGGDYSRIPTSNDESIFAFKRQKGNNEVISIINFSDQEQSFNILNSEESEYKDAFTKETIRLDKDQEISLSSYGFKVIIK